MNNAVISGNHHHSVGSPMPRSSHGMTPYIITRKARPNTTRIDLCRPVMTTVGAGVGLDAEVRLVGRPHVGDDRAGGVAS